MAKPSKLKRAIKVMEVEVEDYKIERASLDRVIADRISTIEMLRKIDGEKTDRKSTGKNS